MANFTYLGTVDGSQPIQETFDVASGTAAALLVGNLVVMTNGYAANVADGGASTAGFYGLVVKRSTETAAAAGTVDVIYSPKGLRLRGVPTTASNLATAIKFDRVTIDVSGTTQTVDENDAGNGIVTITDYYSTNSTIDVVVTATL